MPTYEYQCAKCGKIYDVFQKMSDAPLKKCPVCKSTRIKRLLGSGGGIIFKGTGFYETDYKRKPEPKAASAKPAADKTTPTKASGK